MQSEVGISLRALQALQLSPALGGLLDSLLLVGRIIFLVFLAKLFALVMKSLLFSLKQWIFSQFKPN